MYFLNGEHKKSYYQLMQRYPIASTDLEYKANIYIASVPSIFKYINLKDLDTNSSPLSNLLVINAQNPTLVVINPVIKGHYQELVKLGLSLYNGYPISLAQLFARVTNLELIKVILQAINIGAERYSLKIV